MTPSPNCYSLIEHFEGCRFVAYQDATGTLTIGYGHTGADVHAGLVWTQQQADLALAADVSSAAQAVNDMVQVPLTQNEYDALVSFTFNIGSGDLESSTLLSLLNDSDYVGASKEFPKWDMSKGEMLPGLLTRRLAEQTLFNKGKS